MDLTCRWQLPKLLLKGMYLEIINFKCLLQGCAFLASITYLILHLGNIQEILDFVKMYNLFKNRSASCICTVATILISTHYWLHIVSYHIWHMLVKTCSYLILFNIIIDGFNTAGPTSCCFMLFKIITTYKPLFLATVQFDTMWCVIGWKI